MLNLDPHGTHWTLLKTIYGPSPYWTRVDRHSSLKVEDTCRILYAVTDEMAHPPVLALVRKPNEDYPVAICKHKRCIHAYSDDSTAVSRDPNKTVSESFLEADPSVSGVITYHRRLEEDPNTYSGGLVDLSSMCWASIPSEKRGPHDPHSLTDFIITTKECMWPYLSALSLITQF
jgi:hypothetical protein